MAGDKLTAAYDNWMAKAQDPDLFQAFQAGFSASAVSMRDRAMAIVRAAFGDKGNDAVNKIGSLPDIPA